MNERQGRRHRATLDERGGVAAIVVILLVPLMILVAFTLDLGMAYAQAQAFSAGADSAALAIAKAKRTTLITNPSAPKNCQSLVTGDTGQALAIAKKQADANRPYDLKASTGQVDVQVQLTCVDKDGNPDAKGMLRVTVTVQRDVPTTLGRLAGGSSIKATRNANAGVGVAQDVAGAFPLAICEEQADAIVAKAVSAPYPIETIDVTKVWKADCSSKKGSGNWGWLECGGNGIPVLVDAILNGCDIDLTLTGTPPTISADGTPGNKINAGPVRDALDSVKGKVFPFPVYDKITGNGAGTAYRVIGFINLKFIDADQDGNVNGQYVSYSPVGELNPNCGIGSVNCSAYNAYVLGLNG